MFFHLFLSVFLGFLLLGFQSCNQSQAPASQSVAANVVRQLSETELEKMSKDDLVRFIRNRTKNNSAIQQGPLVDFSKSLSFTALNNTGKTLYVSCFSYIKNKVSTNWRWDKSEVYKILPQKSKTILIDEIDDSRDRNSVVGYLCAFEDEKKAREATVQLLEDSQLMDLDLLYKLKGKTVAICAKQLGVKGEKFEAELDAEQKAPVKNKELDLLLENKAGKNLWVALFVYEKPQKSDDFQPWRYERADLKHIKDGQMVVLDVETIFERYEWQFMRGCLAVFEEKDKAAAELATFELTPSEYKIDLGLLSDYLNKKVVLNVEAFGVVGDFIDYVVKPAAFRDRHRKKN